MIKESMNDVHLCFESVSTLIEQFSKISTLTNDSSIVIIESTKEQNEAVARIDMIVKKCINELENLKTETMRFNL